VKEKANGRWGVPALEAVSYPSSGGVKENAMWINA